MSYNLPVEDIKINRRRILHPVVSYLKGKPIKLVKNMAASENTSRLVRNKSGGGNKDSLVNDVLVVTALNFIS